MSIEMTNEQAFVLMGNLVQMEANNAEMAAWQVIKRLAALGAAVEGMPRDSMLVHDLPDRAQEWWASRAVKRHSNGADYAQARGDTPLEALDAAKAVQP